MPRLSILLALLASAPSAAADGARAMTGQEKLQLPEDLFWEEEPDFGPVVFKFVFHSRFEGLLLGAPADVDLRSRNKLPAYAYAVVDSRKAQDFSFERQAVLIACELTSFACLASLATTPVDREVRDDRPRPPSKNAGRVGGGAFVDARSLLNVPWAPGVWQLVLVARDRRSDPVRVVLRDKNVSPPAPATPRQAHLTVSASGQGLSTILDVRLEVGASRAVFGTGDAEGGITVPVSFVVLEHARGLPRVVRRDVPGHWGPAGEPEHVVASTRVALKELVPAGVHDSALHVWAFAGDQMSDPVRVVMAPP